MAQWNSVAPLIKDLAKVEHDHNIACQECALYRLCLPLGLHNNDLAKLDSIIERSRAYSRGQLLFDHDSPFHSVYVVRSGCFKTTVDAVDGREQVTGFYFPGEFIGMDAIHQQAYQSSAKALETSTVCELPYDKLQQFSASIPQLQTQLLNRLSRELSADKSLMFLLGKKTAEEKLATFLLSLSRRFQERGFSATEIQLSMSRGDMANHLGLAIETVSRLFTRFQNDGLIRVKHKSLSLLECDKLKQLCG